MLTEKTFRPAGAAQCQYAIGVVQSGDRLTVTPDLDCDGGYILETLDGDAVGYLSARHWVSIDLENGRDMLHATVNCTGNVKDGFDTVTVRIVTGDAGDTFEMPPVVPRTYRVGLAGESYRQPAIRRCRIGDPVTLRHDVGNAHDSRAVAAFARGEQIGFLPRDGWLTDAIFDQGKQVSASILSMAAGGGGHMGVVLEVSW